MFSFIIKIVHLVCKTFFKITDEPNIFLMRFKPCRFNSVCSSPIPKCDHSSVAWNENFSFSSLAGTPFDTGAQKHRMTPGGPSSVPEPPRTPVLCEFWVPVKGTQRLNGDHSLEATLHVAGGFSNTIITVKSGGHAGAPCPVTGSRRRGSPGAVHTHKGSMRASSLLFALPSLFFWRGYASHVKEC